MLVRVGEPLGDLGGNCHRAVRRQRLSHCQQCAQFHALDQLHRHERHLAALADVVDGDDVGMIQARGGARFLVEAFLVVLAPLAAGAHVDRLDRERAFEQRVARLVDDAHCAAPEHRLDQIAADGGRLHCRTGKRIHDPAPCPRVSRMPPRINPGTAAGPRDPASGTRRGAPLRPRQRRRRPRRFFHAAAPRIPSRARFRGHGEFHLVGLRRAAQGCHTRAEIASLRREFPVSAIPERTSPSTSSTQSSIRTCSVLSTTSAPRRSTVARSGGA